MAVVAFGVWPAAPAQGDQLDLTFHDGRITLVASDVTLEAILEEWTAVGDTRFVDADGLSDQAIHLQLIDVPEAEALRILLRDVAGYVAAPHPGGAAGRSRFDRVIVMPTSQRAARVHPSAPSRRTAPFGLAPAQRGPRVVTPTGPGVVDPEAFNQDDALESLRELLPDPIPANQMDDPASARDPGNPPTAPRPGMTIEATDETAPVFIRPVRPQRDDP